MSDETPTARELLEGAAEAIRAVAERVDRTERKQLLLAANAIAIAARDADGASATPPELVELADAIRAGAHDGDLDAVRERLRPQIRAKLAAASPGYDAT